MNSKEGKLIIHADKRQNEIFFSVTDTGVGMSQEFIDTRLFKPFATTKSGGVGLGLYTISELVKAYGGNIEVKSQQGVGTTVSVVLPL